MWWQIDESGLRLGGAAGLGFLVSNLRDEMKLDT